MRPPVTLCAAVLCLGLLGSAWAADPLTDAVQAAYPPYRAALFLTNGKDQAEAANAVAQDPQGQPIRVAEHCWGCTAGQGSSCGGALDESPTAQAA